MKTKGITGRGTRITKPSQKSAGKCAANPFTDRYTYELVNTFGFSREAADLIRSLYGRVDDKFGAESELHRAWMCARLLGGLVYGDDASGAIVGVKWKDAAGRVFSGEEFNYFVNTLRFTKDEYRTLKSAVVSQRLDMSTPNFAHMQISLSVRLAYSLKTGWFVSGGKAFASEENASYSAGWLGDAANENGMTSFGDDDYCADLDAENIYRIMTTDTASADAFSSYYAGLTATRTRADVFLSHISYSTVREKIFAELIDQSLAVSISDASAHCDRYMVYYYLNRINDEQYHWDIIRSDYPNTYDFLISLREKSAHLQHFT